MHVNEETTRVWTCTRDLAGDEKRCMQEQGGAERYRMQRGRLKTPKDRACMQLTAVKERTLGKGTMRNGRTRVSSRTRVVSGQDGEGG
jgi:hypothetical protein